MIKFTISYDHDHPKYIEPSLSLQLHKYQTSGVSETIGLHSLILSSNAFIMLVIYLFFSETAYRSLEEIDTIFKGTTNVFDVVTVAHSQPYRYGKNSKFLGKLPGPPGVHEPPRRQLREVR